MGISQEVSCSWPETFGTEPEKNEDPLKGGSCLGEMPRKLCGALDDFEDGSHENTQVPRQSTEAVYCSLLTHVTQ